MDYWFSVTTPANTKKEDAVETEMQVTEGIITHVWLKHPPGCHSLAHATISDGLSQIYPTNKDEDYHGDEFPMEFDDNYELLSPAKLFLHTWNDSTLYSHGVDVRITIQSKAIAQPWQTVSDLVSMLKKLMGI